MYLGEIDRIGNIVSRKDESKFKIIHTADKATNVFLRLNLLPQIV